MQKTQALGCALAFALFVTAAPSRAADDGQASLITGLATTFGLVKQDEPRIDYRERGKLVVPPKRDLPAPSAPSSAQGGGAWPTDVEGVRDAKFKQIEDGEPSARDVANGRFVLIPPGADVKVTTSGFDRHGPECRHPDPKTGNCPDAPRSSVDWNPLHWVGLQKAPPVTLGAEPERQTLVDPPKGMRQPAEGVGAKVEN